MLDYQNKELISPNGVSFAVCCHNSANRLEPTLAHLMKQESSIPYEILIIDNGSSDGTAIYANNILSAKSNTSFRIISEPKIGLSNARVRGFHEAQYDIVVFVDDDNWLSPNWAQTVYEIMRRNPNIGACGGQTEAVCETVPPDWFDRHKKSFAVGKQFSMSGDITDIRGYLWGAGLSVRKSAWNFLEKNGFHFTLSDRKGNLLLSGGDSELCFALRLAGWRLWYDERLQLQHYIPFSRLNWRYLRRLFFAFGVSSPYLSAYRYILNKRSIKQLAGRFNTYWIYPMRRSLSQVIQNKRLWLLSKFDECYSNDEVLDLEYYSGRFLEFIRLRNKFDEQICKLSQAEWNLLYRQEGVNALSHTR